MKFTLVVHLLLASIISLFLSSCAKAKLKPELPCRTPEELKQALDFALNTHDTNFFWSVHTWTNVTPASERFHKAVCLQSFPQQPGDKISFNSFRISPAPPEIKEIADRNDPSKPRFNLPIEGVIYCREKARRKGVGVSSMTLEFPFGKMPDGAYWLAVLTRDSITNASSQQR